MIAAEQHGYEARTTTPGFENAEVWSGSVQADWLNALVTPVFSGPLFFAEGFFARSSTGFIPATSIVRIIHLRLDISQQVLRRLPGRKPAIVSNLSNRRGDVGRNLANSW